MKDEEMQVMGETGNLFSKPSRTGNMKTLGWEKSWRDQETRRPVWPKHI